MRDKVQRTLCTLAFVGASVCMGSALYNILTLPSSQQIQQDSKQKQIYQKKITYVRVGLGSGLGLASTMVGLFLVPTRRKEDTSDNDERNPSAFPTNPYVLPTTDLRVPEAQTT